MPDFVTRFAPSPTGRLHLGHAASALQVWRAAQAAGGRVLLRIEDVDTGRCRPEYAAGIVEDLTWLGLSWSGPVRRQSDHFADYARVIDHLAARGLVYRCFRTRREIAAALPAGADPDIAGFTGGPLPDAEEAERLAHQASFAWRLSLRAARRALGPRYSRLSFLEECGGTLQVRPARPEIFGDVVIARKDTPASYHLACCHDDALQGVTHVIRGEDMREVTHIHALLQALMDWPPPVYRFHPLIMGPDGRKLSKRFADKALAAYRAEGYSPGEVMAMTGVA